MGTPNEPLDLPLLPLGASVVAHQQYLNARQRKGSVVGDAWYEGPRMVKGLP